MSAAYVVRTEKIFPQRLKEALSATGGLHPWESIQLRTERPGIVREIAFVEGGKVRKGDLLVKIDDSELRAQLQRAEAELALAASSEKRQRDLLTKRGISSAEYEESLANLGIARANVELIRAQLAKTEIRAPFDGVAGLRNISPGAYLTPDTVIASFQDNRSLRLDFSVPERYLAYIKPGQKVEFEIAGRVGKHEAEIYAIEPTVEEQTRSLIVRAHVDNSDGQLVPGAFADVRVILEEIENALLIPPQALIPGLKQQSVYLYKDGVAEHRVVETGLRTNDAIQITHGLSPGEEVITTGILQLRPGMKVARQKSQEE